MKSSRKILLDVQLRLTDKFDVISLFRSAYFSKRAFWPQGYNTDQEGLRISRARTRTEMPHGCLFLCRQDVTRSVKDTRIGNAMPPSDVFTEEFMVMRVPSTASLKFFAPDELKPVRHTKEKNKMKF